MTRAAVKRRLALLWWRQLALTLAPLLLINLLFGAGRQPGVLAMPLFIAGLASLFVSLPLFSAYKRALFALAKALNTIDEPAAWLSLAERRRPALLGAGLPAWIAALAVFAGLEAVPQILLALASVVVFYLYRTPRQF